jgi:twitching motility protein PilT
MNEPDRLTETRIARFFRMMKEWNATDMHLSVGRPPMFRVNGSLDTIRYRALSDGDFRALVEPITPPHVWANFEQTGDADFAYEQPGVARFRVNLFRQERGMGGVFRNLAANLVSLSKLNLPESIEKLVQLRSGLVVVTGPTGSGKSTTLAAILSELNARRPLHVITIEDPIEFVHANKKSLVSQRELSTHTESFASALLAAARENPDVILIGEMRDLETIRLALEAAETGVLVFGTLHTNSAAKTLDRLVGAFPADEQAGVRVTLAGVLRCVVAQQLLRRKTGGRVAAVELMFANQALAAMIREGKTFQVPSVIAGGKAEGMVAMDEALRALVEQDAVDGLDALEKALEKDAFRDWLRARGVALADDA